MKKIDNYITRGYFEKFSEGNGKKQPSKMKHFHFSVQFPWTHGPVMFQCFDSILKVELLQDFFIYLKKIFLLPVHKPEA